MQAFLSHLLFLSPPPHLQAQLLEAKKQLETQNTLQQKTKELLRSSEQQVVALKAQLASASSSEAVTSSSNTSTPATRTAALRAPLRGKLRFYRMFNVNSDGQKNYISIDK